MPKPTITAPTDAIVRISNTTICGTDLHIMKGDVPTVLAGRILGHEGTGIIDAIGSGVSSLKVGDRVLISCITSCAKCDHCKSGMLSHCDNGGWILGHLIDGTQAEFVRIPFADTSLYHISKETDIERFVMLSDILPTGFECGVLNGTVKPGDTVAIVGAGPIGLATLLTALFYSPAELIVIDIDTHRLEVAKQLGATVTIDNSNGRATQEVMNITGNRGVDVSIEAVGTPEAFAICESIVAAGGHIANIGVHGKPVQLNLDKLWAHNITLTTRLVDTTSTPLLMKTVASGRLKPETLITHHFSLDNIMKAYDVFSDATKEKALKVIITNSL